MKKLTIYLCGGMENSEKLGAKWREEITPFLKSLEFEILNPCEFEPQQLQGLRPNRLPEYYTDLHGNKIEPTHWHQLKDASEPHLYERFLKYMQRIIRYDCNVIKHKTDFLLCYWDESTSKGAGTHAELTLAFLKNIPIYIVAASDIPAWAKGCTTRDKIFLSFDDVKKALENDIKD